MNKKRATRKVTLRQRMRSKAAEQIAGLERIVIVGVERALEESGVILDPHDVMRLFGNSQTKYLKEKAITSLANQYENELEALYNRQQDLNLKGKDDDNDDD